MFISVFVFGTMDVQFSELGLGFLFFVIFEIKF